MSDRIIALTHPDDIAFFRILSLKAALKLECKGMSRRGTSAYKIVKDEFGFKGNKEQVLAQLLAYIDEVNAARSTPAIEE